MKYLVIPLTLAVCLTSPIAAYIVTDSLIVAGFAFLVAAVLGFISIMGTLDLLEQENERKVEL